jgi:hypothetical protein
MHRMTSDFFSLDFAKVCAVMTHTARAQIPPVGSGLPCADRLSMLDQNQFTGHNHAVADRTIDSLSIDVEGDEAFARPSSGPTEPLRFVRRAGRWYLEFMPQDLTP